MNEVVLEGRNLSKVFGGGRTLLGRPKPALNAVQEVSFKLRARETLGIVGESGCGKSTLARMIVGLAAPTEGEVFIEGHAVSGRSGTGGWGRGGAVQYVFQDPVGSLNPRHTVRQALEAPLIHLVGLGRKRRAARIGELMEAVGLRAEFIERYPHEFSGGQAQRVAIARALAAEPKIIVLDEPVSALDVSVQAQILNLLADLQQHFGLSYVFISHDLAVIEAIADRVAVMYFGRIVEVAPSQELFRAPQHPYTQLLIGSVPAMGKRGVISDETPSELPDPLAPPPGCAFAARCFRAEAECLASPPRLRLMAGERAAACLHPLDHPGAKGGSMAPC